MDRLGLFAASLAAVITGGVKLGGTVFATKTFMLPSCLGSNVYIEIGETSPIWHCWGCYVLAVGLAVLMALAGHEYRRNVLKVQA